MSKIFNDPIHGRIEIPDYCVDIIDTVEFQRLRNLKQLGFTNYVFSGATHSRFEHSIGVCYIAGEWAKHLQNKHPELMIVNAEIAMVQIAGLIHDLGHGPFSHTFERYIKKVRPEINYNHEMMTIKICNQMIKSMSKLPNKLPNTDKDFLDKIEKIIKGEPLEQKPYLAHIVHNTINGLDADKLDYFIRDSQCTSFAIGCDWKRIIYESSVKDNEIVFPYKMIGDIFNIYQTRFRLYKELYYHKTSRIIEDNFLMLLEEADKKHVFNFNNYGLANSIDDVASFLLTQDDIIGQIERCNYPELIIHLNLIKQRYFDEYADLKTHPRIAHYGMKELNPLSFVKFITKDNKYVDKNDPDYIDIIDSMCPKKFSLLIKD